MVNIDDFFCREEWRTRKERAEEERQRSAAASSASAAFGYTTYTKLPGKKSSYVSGGASSTRPRSASNVRSGSNMRSGGSHVQHLHQAPQVVAIDQDLT